MASVEIEISGRRYTVACRDGEEPHLQSVAALVDRKAQDAAAALGSLSETSQLLFASLLLADELKEKRAAPEAAPAGGGDLPRTRLPLEAEARPSTGRPFASVSLCRRPCYGTAMGERASAAIDRIERALARIEAAATRPAAAAPMQGDSKDVAALREAHRTLRSRVEGAVAQIDRLLEAEGAG